MKKIAILGSTGSIGRQTLDVAREQKDIEVTALCARKSVDLIEAQIREFRPKTAVMWDEEAAKDLRIRVKDMDVKVLAGMDGILEVASMEGYDYFVTAIMGMVGVRPTVDRACEQRDSGHSRSYHYAAGREQGRSDPPCGQ